MYDDIILLVKAVKYGSFLALAKREGIAQSTISRRIQFLEQELGIQLIKRNTRSFELTEKGEILYENFKNCENNLRTLVDPIYANEHSINGLLNIVLPQAFSGYSITPYLGEFIRSHPGLNLSVIYQYRPIDMVKEQYDLAITSFIPLLHTQVIKTIHKCKLILVCSRKYIERYGLLTSLKAENNVTIGTPTKNGSSEDHIILGAVDENGNLIRRITIFNEETNEHYEIPNDFRLRSNSHDQSKILVADGHAISGIPEEAVVAELESGEFIRVMPDYHFGYITYYMLRNLDASDRRYKIFDEFIKNCMAKLPALS